MMEGDFPEFLQGSPGLLHQFAFGLGQLNNSGLLGRIKDLQDTLIVTEDFVLCVSVVMFERIVKQHAA